MNPAALSYAPLPLKFSPYILTPCSFFTPLNSLPHSLILSYASSAFCSDSSSLPNPHSTLFMVLFDSYYHASLLFHPLLLYCFSPPVSYSLCPIHIPLLILLSSPCFLLPPTSSLLLTFSDPSSSLLSYSLPLLPSLPRSFTV